MSYTIFFNNLLKKIPVTKNRVSSYIKQVTTESSIFNYATDVLKNKTKIGRGIQKAKEAVKIKLKNINNDETSLFGKLVKQTDKKTATYFKLRQDKNFMSTYELYVKKRGIKCPDNLDLNDEKVIQEIIESSGVGPTKLAQIISSNDAYMLQIEQKMPALAKAIRGTRSNCSFSRTIDEAQAFLDKSFPGKGLVIEKEMSAGSIGAAYIIRKPDGSKAVVKMLKKGVNAENMELEEKLCNRIIEEIADSPEDARKIKDQLSQYYKDWKTELDFTAEYEYNKILATGAKRYKVADITDLSADGKCIVMDMASGVQMNKLVEILNDYKSNPNEYFVKYANLIEKNPWLKNPENVSKELPTILLKTFDEQFMFMKKGGKSLMHGDPHTGNFFITQDSKGRLIPEFIDTGNCVARSGKEIINDVEFFTNYFVGNSEGIAKYFINQCGYNGNRKEALIKMISNEIQTNIFNSKQNITNFTSVQENIQSILKRHGLELSPENATALKAQMQFFTAISEAASLSGKSGLKISTIIKDVPRASYGMIKAGVNPWPALKESFKYLRKNREAAVANAWQFKITDETSNVFKATDGKGIIS